MKKVNKKHLSMLIAGSLIIVIVIVLFIFYLFRDTEKIKFKEGMDQIEYGSEISYPDMIEKVASDKAKVTYPTTEVKEVGTYHVTFLYEEDDTKEEIEYTFQVIDTKKPKISLYLEEDTIQVKKDTQYDLFSNIMDIQNFSTESLQNRKLVDETEYQSEKKRIKQSSEKIQKRVITNKKTKVEDTVQQVIYHTNLDMSKTGMYEVKVLVIDENYNYDEKNWKIEVVESSEILNSGGNVSCEYLGEDQNSTDAYTTTIHENYKFNPLKVIEQYELITTMVFNNGYDTTNNANMLIQAIEDKYRSYEQYDGVSVNVEKVNVSIVTKIIVNFKQYDLKKDPLDILVKKDGEYVPIQQILEDAEKNQFTCTLQ